MLDLRKPAGLYFLLLGLLLLGAGLVNPGYSAPLLNVNLNLYFGIFCVCFGGLFLWLSRQKA
jgi:hypothetical protein